MLKVVIADDEERVCRLVQMLVDWNALGMEVVGMAANGFEALELLKEHNPDILITDIRMPGCNGLELIEKAREILPNLEITLISGYAQFEYAQMAMSFGINSYILKPINKDTLISTLQKLGDKCRERAMESAITERLNQESQKSNTILNSHLLQDLIKKRIEHLSREELRNKYAFDVKSDILQVFILKIDFSPKLIGSSVIDIIMAQTREIFESKLAPLCDAYLFQFSLFAGYGVINCEKSKLAEVRRSLRDCLNILQGHKFGAVELTLAIGMPVTQVDRIVDSMHDAQIAIAERFIEGTGKMLEGELPEVPLSVTRKLLEKYNRMVQQFVDSLSIEDADLAVDKLRKDTFEIENLRGYIILDIVISAGKIFITLLKMGDDEELAREYEELCTLQSSVDKLFNCLKEFQQTQIKIEQNRLKNEAMRPIRIAKQYIANHYSEPITLDDVCSAVGFSVSYFSTMFKKETGEGFAKYLKRIRIERAKELLQDTNLSIAEICELVGYNDVKHFTESFKKITKLNPGQYRKLRG